MEPIKIHPLDLSAMLDDRLATFNMVINYKFADGRELPENQFLIDGQLYEQTADVAPCRPPKRTQTV